MDVDVDKGGNVKGTPSITVDGIGNDTELELFVLLLLWSFDGTEVDGS